MAAGSYRDPAGSGYENNACAGRMTLSAPAAMVRTPLFPATVLSQVDKEITMITAFFLATSINASSVCVTKIFDNNHVWLSGIHEIFPVSKPFQDSAISELGNNSFIALDYPKARSFLMKEDFPDGFYYYLAKVGYRGDGLGPGNYPSSIKLGIEVDENNIAYLHSFVLTKQNGDGYFSAVIKSEIPIKDVFSLCGSAE
ncbi:hypothetical protein [Niveispirillum sp. BGYR6]|uniref:hypothetical protein n=1 Tax=Niveispirillum sp. BGYR6 TaxID=2971249 RepID=UPI0022B951E8|nr:hypothetical protein [Niveispirillum sp. BGYR6]MDG5494916.1 hypothetical protein [Niveispirillum sp. BGYR6]